MFAEERALPEGGMLFRAPFTSALHYLLHWRRRPVRSPAARPPIRLRTLDLALRFRSLFSESFSSGSSRSKTFKRQARPPSGTGRPEARWPTRARSNARMRRRSLAATHNDSLIWVAKGDVSFQRFSVNNV